MTAFLPQQDPNPNQRQADLAEMQASYQYNHTYVSPLAMVEKVPDHDEFSIRWLVATGERALTILANHAENDGDPERKAKTREKHGLFSSLVQALTIDFKGVVHLIEEAFGAADRNGHMTSLEEYGDMFRTIGLPPIAQTYQQDAVFAEMRLAGPNPVMLRRVKELGDHFPVTEEHYRVALPADSLAAAMHEGRLYLADYRYLEGVQNGQFPDAPKYLYAPLALFAVEKTSGQLVPVAIQCKQTPAPDNPIFTPDDGWNWFLAKTIVEVADGNYHEAVTHLGRTHLFLEPFVISTQRQLAANHPLGLLLRPHFQCTLAINDYAYKHLINDGGPVDELLAGTIQSTRGLTARGIQEYRVNDVFLPTAFKSRGVEDPNLLPNYPYRDDGMLYWNAIRQWVADYVRIYYQTDADVQEDTELAAWYQELIAQEGGRIAGLGDNGRIATVTYLIDVVTLIIYTASVQHAAVNFPQYDLMSYAPNMPLACYTPAPTKKKGATLEDALAMLPPRRPAGLQMSLGYLLGTLHYTQLGEYGWHYFSDSRVKAPLATFQKQLEAIGRTISERNAVRRPYEFLIPTGIPQSINV